MEYSKEADTTAGFTFGNPLLFLGISGWGRQ